MIKLLVVHASILSTGGCLLAIGLVQMAGGMCGGCRVGVSVGGGEAAGWLSGWGLALVGMAVVVQSILSSTCYFLYRLIDHPPHRFRSLAVVLLAACLPWPVGAILLSGMF